MKSIKKFLRIIAGFKKVFFQTSVFCFATPKKFFWIFVFFQTLLSCHTAKYYFEHSTHRTGVDFTKGKWLLNDLDCPENSKEKLTLETVAFFTKYTNDRFYRVSNAKGLLIPNAIPLNPNKIQLKSLKDGTGFDFFINIKARKNKNDYGTIALYENEKSSGKNESVVILEIYDLNLQQIIYSKKAFGVSGKSPDISGSTPKNSTKLIDNIEFFKNSDQLMHGALKKIFKDLKKTSIKE